jgi:hypothetical protein
VRMVCCVCMCGNERPNIHCHSRGSIIFMFHLLCGWLVDLASLATLTYPQMVWANPARTRLAKHTRRPKTVEEETRGGVSPWLES